MTDTHANLPCQPRGQHRDTVAQPYTNNTTTTTKNNQEYSAWVCFPAHKTCSTTTLCEYASAKSSFISFLFLNADQAWLRMCWWASKNARVLYNFIKLVKKQKKTKEKWNWEWHKLDSWKWGWLLTTFQYLEGKEIECVW